MTSFYEHFFFFSLVRLVRLFPPAVYKLQLNSGVQCYFIYCFVYFFLSEFGLKILILKLLQFYFFPSLI